jgi:CHAD domain-containing protein
MTSRDVQPLTAAESIGKLALGVLRKQLDAVRAHEAGTREGGDPEELHDMRVATRRLRAALRSFADVLPPEAEAVRAELQWLGSSLSAVRDFDVQLGQLRTWQKSLPEADEQAMASLVATVTEERHQARGPLLEALDSERYTALLASCESLVQTELPAAAAEAVATWAPRLVERCYRRLRKSGDGLDGQSPAEELHALRIRGKRLRYLVEFLTPAYGEPAERFTPRVVALQDVLGGHQDAHVAVERLRALMAARHDEITPELGFLMGELAERYANTAGELRRKFVPVYSQVTGARWRKLRKALESAAAAVARGDTGR